MSAVLLLIDNVDGLVKAPTMAFVVPPATVRLVNVGLTAAVPSPS